MTDARFMGRKMLIAVSVGLVVLSALDVFTTSQAMGVGAIETNLIFQAASLRTMIVAKAVAISLIIGVCWRFKLIIPLILGLGLTLGAVWRNIGAIIIGGN